MSIERQLEIMGSKAFESGINKVDPIFQMRDFRLMYDYRTSDVNGAGSVGADWDEVLSHPVYPNNMITIISVNCTTINKEFNPNDPENNSLFAFDPIRYMCYGDDKFKCLYRPWTDASASPTYVELKQVIEMRR